MNYSKETPIEEVLRAETRRIAYKLAEVRGFGRPDEDWMMASRILNDKNWQGTGMSYADVIIKYYYRNR